LEVEMDTQTRDNVFVALHGEAFAYARYMFYADAARERGNDRLAAMLEGIAGVELSEHFEELAQLVGLAGTDVDNLRTVIQDEGAEVEEIYRAFAEQARLAGEAEVAARFEEIRGDEREHLKTLEGAIEQLEVPA
jgi:rubrerythrin